MRLEAETGHREREKEGGGEKAQRLTRPATNNCKGGSWAASQSEWVVVVLPSPLPGSAEASVVARSNPSGVEASGKVDGFEFKTSCRAAALEEGWRRSYRRSRKEPKAQSTGQNADQLKRTKQQCCSALRKLLQKIQGLPPTLPSLPLELTVLYNTIILQISSSECITEQDVGGMNQGLFRVLEATGACSEETDMVEVWHQVWDKAGGGELGPSLSRLACLQGALWLPGNQLEKIQALFHLLSTGEVSFPIPLCLYCSMFQQQVALLQREGSIEVFLDSQSVLPRIPEVYLETALALLNAKRHHDVLTVCEEVVSKTLALVPERLVLELFPAGPRRTESADGCGELRYSGPAASELHWAKESHPLASRKRESLNHAIWTAAAYLYQGQAFAQLQDTMESITCFTRCINLLHRVQVVFSGNDHTCAESLGDKAVEIKWFQKLKALAFFGRGMQFQERGQERESLHNFQLSLQAVPDNLEAAYFLVELLWKTNRKQEAASCWLRVQNSLGKEAGEKAIPKREYPLYLQLHLRKVHAAEEELVSEKIHKYSSTSGHGT
nr:PREDICTED: Fanconi anemia group G protein [Latimeria chalumnae]|eukprot:XP_014348515.1 PREDICTED: Fanconi anemia group G protein [Latimeria chalumnae]